MRKPDAVIDGFGLPAHQYCHKGHPYQAWTVDLYNVYMDKSA